MILLNNLSVQFGSKILFKDVNALINPHDRIGIVGSNGAGKTTLLKIIAGITQPDTGNVQKANYVSIGYLAQETISLRGKTLYQEAETAFGDILEIKKRLNEAEINLAQLNPESEEYAETLEVLGEMHYQLEDLDAYRMRSKIEKVMNGLGFSQNDLNRLTDEFSGGWQMRIAMAKLLLQEPSALLLDEPTNHLDLDSLQWLEEYLKQYNGAVIIVSHDKTFLDNITKKTFSLSMGKMESYAGNYSFYEKEKETRKQLLINQQKNQQSQIKDTKEFIERFRYKATKARQVQSRIKMLDKIEIIEVEQEEENLRFKFPQPTQSGKVVMELKNIHKSYGNLEIFNDLNLKIERGDKIAVVGVNGAGKSTLMRILCEDEEFDKGERILGYNTIISYFGQDQANELDLSKDVLQSAEEVATTQTKTQVRTLLGSFLFHGDDVFKKVSVLSGGEKSRLALVRMLLTPANFLIMDEPTNHLDMRSKIVLQNALAEFEGTIITVSHDRDFLNPFVNKVIELQPGKIKCYIGGLSDYLLKKKDEIDNCKIHNQHKEVKHIKNVAEEKSHKKSKEKELRLIKKQLEKIELEISNLEKSKTGIEKLLSDSELYKDGEKAKQVSDNYKIVQKDLNGFYWEWSKLSEELERCEKS